MRRSSKALLVVTEGSIQDAADKHGKPVAVMLMDVELVALVDMSGSMCEKDARDNEKRLCSRYDAAESELRKLQAEYPGKVAVIGFSGEAVFYSGGIPVRQGGSTRMDKALEEALPYDTLAKVVLISDGYPDSNSSTLSVAAKFHSPIHTVYIGAAGGEGAGFLRRLAKQTGGKFAKSKVPGSFHKEVAPLLLAEESTVIHL